ncbi:G-protein coupled receptor Mth2 isoform X2 [Bicyclus anynana]|uniref:G-protein coupled receptor Mth2 isoform X2 n=1 Tax=Bicyclus anynana TaxID=110368 RepID=A0ABM3LQK4_BICAN|nr:G-protein coupled receptor Mth2 isoform X2 [Bicyclus anynana]
MSGQLIIELITNNAYQDPLSVESFCVDSSETNNTYAIVFRVTIAEKASSSQVRELIISIDFLFYFFILGSFFWMNILSYDIWKQFRSKQLRSYREERGEYRRKFIAYSIYAWGTPLLMATALICLDMDYIDVRSKPRFLKPNIIANRCFFGKYERLYYLYTPMLILIGANWVFFCMTGYLIWKTKRACRGVGMNSTPNNIKHRLIIFLRLSLVMGISWVLEVVSSMKSDSPVWYITDLYNIMLGVGIFIITVCNQRVYKLVKQRFGRERTYISKSAKINSDTTQESSLADDRSNDTQMKLINKETARVLPESNV